MGLNVFDLDARIGISTKKFIDAVKEAGKSGKDLSKELDNVNPHVKAVENRLDEAAKAAEETKKKVNDLSDAYNKSAKEAGKDADETKELADELKKAEKELEKAKREVNYLEKELEKESQAAEEGAGETKKLGTEVKTAGDNAEKSSSKFKDLASNIKDGLEAAAKVGVVAVGAAATGVSALVKSSVAEYSEYEQLVGGVNKLFGEAGNSVIENAMNAYATSGMSANEYMSQVTGFAASLIQATGRGEQQNIDDLQDALDEEYALTKQTLADEYDAVKENWNDRIKESRKAKDGEADLLTKQRDEELKALKKANEEKLNTLKQHNKDVIAETERANNQSESTFESLTKAADLADVAMRSISDNVNTFGTDMASVQNAYQGFAKQNYTMLDNLRLGYGGTKAEMERLIDDANEYAESIGEASDLSINSFADIVTAIDLIQKKQGIWKTTEKEAAGTITGSISAVRAAWKNLTVEMAKEDGDVNKAFQILGENFGGVIMNILPKVQNAIGGVGTLITQAAPQISKGLQDLLPKVLPQLIKSAGQLVSAVGQGVITSLPTLLDTGKELLASIADIDFEGNGVIGDLLDAIVGNVDEYFGYGERILSNIGNAIINADHSKLGETFSKVITSGLNSITDLLADLDMQKVGKNIADFINAVDWKAIAQSVVDLLGAALGSLGDIAISFFTNINGESFLNALAVFAAPKLLGSMLTAFKGSECQTQFGSIRDYMGAEIGKGGKEAGVSYMTAFEVGAKAFIAGWGIGTAIRNSLIKEFGEENVNWFFSTGALQNLDTIKEITRLEGEKEDTFTDKNGVERYKYDLNGEETQAYKLFKSATSNTAVNSNETFKYYANGGLQSAYKYDDFGNFTEEWKKYGGIAFGDGGRVTKPTIALVGEKEPETMVPDSKRGQFGTTNYNTFNISIDGTGKNAEQIADEAIEVISTKLDILGIQQQRAVGGKSWA